MNITSELKDKFDDDDSSESEKSDEKPVKPDEYFEHLLSELEEELTNFKEDKQD